MKVLFCDNSLRNLFNFRGDVITSFLQRGYQVTIAIPRSAENDLTIIPNGVKCCTMQVNPNGLNPIADIRYFTDLVKLYRKVRPDIIFHYTIKPNIYGTLAARICRIKTAAMVAGLGYMFTNNSATKLLGRALYKLALRLSHKVFVLNQANHDLLISRGFVKKNRIRLLEGGEGVNLTKFQYSPKQFLQTRFLMIARVLYDKGYSEFVEAAEILKKKYPNAKVELLGPMAENSPMGVPYSIVNSDVKAGKINYLGETSDVTSYLRKDGTIVVLSSYHEGFNRSLIEACAMGCPIITSDIPGCREAVIHEENGLLVPVKNSEALANAMIRFMEMSPNEKQRYSEKSHSHAVNLFSIDKVISAYDDFINPPTDNITFKSE